MRSGAGRPVVQANEPIRPERAGLSQVLTDLAGIEPLLRRSADLVLVTTESPARVADELLRRVAELGP